MNQLDQFFEDRKLAEAQHELDAKYGEIICNAAVSVFTEAADVKAEMSEKSGQLIECVNPEHRYLGSIHYKQDSCVGNNILAESIGRCDIASSGGAPCED